MADETRIALLDILTHELEKLRRLSGGSAEVLGDGERKALEAIVRIYKLLGPDEEGRPAAKWDAASINQVLEGGGESVPMVREAEAIRRYTPLGGEGRRDDEADEAFRDLHL